MSDNTALDLASTLVHRRTPETRRDLLDHPVALSAWAQAAGLVSRPVRVTWDQFRRTIELREATYRLADACISQARPDARDLAVVNEAAEAAASPGRLTAFGSVRRREDADAVLAAVARSAIELLGGPQHRLISRCSGKDCTRLFVDRSRGHNRRWCNMQDCGNQAKATAYRRRQERQSKPISS